MELYVGSLFSNSYYTNAKVPRMMTINYSKVDVLVWNPPVLQSSIVTH